MSTTRHLTLGALTALTLATAACGVAPNASAPVTGVKAAAHTLVAAGTTRKLGYNIDRYNRVISRIAHPVHLPRQGALPAAQDNRQWCAPVYDQGQLGSCTAFAMAKGLREYLERKNGEQATPLSALFMYYNERVLEGSVGEDSGATMADGMKVLHDTGAADDSLWPYSIGKFTQKPPQAAFDNAVSRKLTTAPVQLASLDDVKTTVANGGVAAIGFVVYNSFEYIGSNGVMPMPKKGEGILGGHAVLVVGYDDAKQMLTVRNSWSGGWGDKGYFYMPYAFYTGTIGKQANVMEAWTASK